MANYLKIKEFIQRWEGGFVNNPNDMGGATNKGITLSTYRNTLGSGKTVDDLMKITDVEWDYIFGKYYYRPSGADRIYNDSISLLVADMAWMSGVKTTVRKVQRLLGVDVDGIVGKQTLGAINNYPNQRELFMKIKEMRMNWLCLIVHNNPSQKVFLKGWMNRLQDIKYVSK